MPAAVASSRSFLSTPGGMEAKLARSICIDSRRGPRSPMWRVGNRHRDVPKTVLIRSSSLHNRNRSKARSARPATAVRMPKVEIRMSSIRIGPLSGNSCSKSLSPATPTAGRPTPVASGTSVVDGSPAVGSLSRSTTVQSWESPSFIRISQLLAVMSPTQDRRPAGRSQGRACQHPGKNREDGGQLRTPPVDCASGIAASVVTDFGPGCLGQAGGGSVHVHETVQL